MVTMMPDIAQRIGVPRAVGVPFPFGHPLGHADDKKEQRLVLGRALGLLTDATGPGSVIELDLEWPDPDRRWRKRWHPKEPAPIIKALTGR